MTLSHSSLFLLFIPFDILFSLVLVLVSYSVPSLKRLEMTIMFYIALVDRRKERKRMERNDDN